MALSFLDWRDCPSMLSVESKTARQNFKWLTVLHGFRTVWQTAACFVKENFRCFFDAIIVEHVESSFAVSALNGTKTSVVACLA
jgi:hypothetical protein